MAKQDEQHLVVTPVDGVQEKHDYRGSAGGRYDGEDLGLPERTKSPNAVAEKFYTKVDGVEEGKG